MDPASVKGIANLVAASVPNLKACLGDDHRRLGRDAVAHGRRRGRWRRRLTACRARPRPRLSTTPPREASLQSMLDRTLGQDKAQVVVHSDLNVDKIDAAGADLHRQGRRRSPRRRPPRSLKGTGSTSGGTSGTASNLPSYAANATGGSGNNNYKNTTTDKTNGADKTITKTQKATGAINRIDVARPAGQVGQPASRADDRAEGQPRLGRRPADRPAQGHAEHHDRPRVRQGADHGRQGRPDPAGLRRHPQGRRASASARCSSSSSSRATCASASAASSSTSRRGCARSRPPQPKELMPMPRPRAGGRRGGDRRVDRQRRPAPPAARHDHPG